MSSYEVDFDEIMEKCCEDCGHIEYRSGARGSFGEPLDPDYCICPAGEPGEGELEFDGSDTFYCVQAGDMDSRIDREVDRKIDQRRGL